MKPRNKREKEIANEAYIRGRDEAGKTNYDAGYAQGKADALKDSAQQERRIKARIDLIMAAGRAYDAISHSLSEDTVAFRI